MQDMEIQNHSTSSRSCCFRYDFVPRSQHALIDVEKYKWRNSPPAGRVAGTLTTKSAKNFTDGEEGDQDRTGIQRTERTDS